MSIIRCIINVVNFFAKLINLKFEQIIASRVMNISLIVFGQDNTCDYHTGIRLGKRRVRGSPAPFICTRVRRLVLGKRSSKGFTHSGWPSTLDLGLLMSRWKCRNFHPNCMPFTRMLRASMVEFLMCEFRPRGAPLYFSEKGCNLYTYFFHNVNIILF